MTRLRIRTGSRLHFGLMGPSLEPANRFGGAGTESARVFGGAGLMIESPGIDVAGWLDESGGTAAIGASPKVSKSAVERASRVRDRVVSALGLTQGEIPTIVVHAVPAEHRGLGVGTQLALAVGWLIASLSNRAMSLEALAGLVDRGRRSAIGVHGFAHGGFLIDGGKGPKTEIAPLVSRVDFPVEWPIVVIDPPLPAGRHGKEEELAFETMSELDVDVSGKMSELLVRHMVPAILERGHAALCSSLSDYNRMAGAWFAHVQGGEFAHGEIRQFIDWLDTHGVVGAQSSWGPTVFCIMDDFNAAQQLVVEVEQRFSWPTGTVSVTVANNSGAQILEESGPNRPGDLSHVESV